MYFNIKIAGGGTQEQVADALFHLAASILHMSDEDLELNKTAVEDEILCAEFTSDPYERPFYKHEEEFNLMTDSACYVDESGIEYTYQHFLDLAFGSEQLARRMFEGVEGGHPLDIRHNLVSEGMVYIDNRNRVYIKDN